MSRRKNEIGKSHVDWPFIERLLGEEKIRTLLLYGPSGTGKTFACYTMGRIHNGVYAITLTEESLRDGRVIDAASGAPLGGVTLRFGVYPYSEPVSWWFLGMVGMLHYQEVVTDDEGGFQIMEDGEGLLFIRHPGFRRRALTPDDRLRIAGPAGPLTIGLVRGESVSGVYRPKSGLAESSSVGISKITPEVNEHGYPFLPSFGYVNTDAEGRFGWDDLEPGRFIVELRPKDLALDVRYRRTLELASGDHLEIELGSDFGPLTFRGQLLDDEGRPQDMVSLILRPKFDWSYSAIACHVDTHRDGRFLFKGLEPGAYEVEARSWQHGKFPLPDLVIHDDLVRDLVVVIP